MTKLEPTGDQLLRSIAASCPRLLYALHGNPEAVWGEIMVMELTAEAYVEACSGFPDKAAAAHEMMLMVGALRSQMAQDGLVSYEELAAFRQGVAAIQSGVSRLRNAPVKAVQWNNRRLKTYIFYCSNNLDAGQLASVGEEVGGETVKTIGLPCSGKVDVPYLVKALETGADGVAIVACKKKECRHFEGSLRAHKRAQAVESLMEEIGLGVGRIAVIECAEGGAGTAREEIKRFIEQVRSLPQAAPAPVGAVNKREQMVA